jgi:hypothetical protein
MGLNHLAGINLLCGGAFIRQITLSGLTAGVRSIPLNQRHKITNAITDDKRGTPVNLHAKVRPSAPPVGNTTVLFVFCIVAYQSVIINLLVVSILLSCVRRIKYSPPGKLSR